MCIRDRGEDDGDVVKNTLARLDGKRPVLASNAVGGESALRLMDMLAPGAVSYTHLDVYKRQVKRSSSFLTDLDRERAESVFK